MSFSSLTCDTLGIDLFSNASFLKGNVCIKIIHKETTNKIRNMILNFFNCSFKGFISSKTDAILIACKVCKIPILVSDEINNWELSSNCGKF